MTNEQKELEALLLIEQMSGPPSREVKIWCQREPHLDAIRAGYPLSAIRGVVLTCDCESTDKCYKQTEP